MPGSKEKIDYAPIIVFAYNRADCLENLLMSLERNEKTTDMELFIFIDIPLPDDKKNIGYNKKVIDFAYQYRDRSKKFKTIQVSVAHEHRGLANSVIAGVSKIIDKYGKVIVLEDDLVVSGDFLDYMQRGLSFYEHNTKIWAISAYSPPMEKLESYEKDIFLTLRISSWGWGTWRDRWIRTDWDVKTYSQFRKNKVKQFLFNLGGNDLCEMLEAQMNDVRHDSWAVRWAYQQFLEQKYSVYPKESRVIHCGNDSRSTHRGEVLQQKLKKNYKKCRFQKVGINYRILWEFRKINSHSDHLDLKKIKNGLAYQHMLRMIKSRPLDINIETTTLCPLKCRFCCNRLYERNSQIMSIDLFERIILQYCEMGGGTVGISSMQSDLFSDPNLLERMRIIKKYKKNLWLHTTTSLISAAKYNDEELISIMECFDYWVISAEGYDRESYQEMAGVDGFKTFYEQLERVKRIINQYSLTIDIEIAFRTCDVQKLKESEFYSVVSDMFYIGDIKDSFFSWFGSVKKSDLPKGAKLFLTYNNRKRIDCVVPNATLAVQASGKVIGCGCIDWLEKYCVGDVNRNTLKEIWTSSKARKFRHAFQNGSLPSICKECGLYTPVICFRNVRLLKYNSMNGLYYWRKLDK